MTNKLIKFIILRPKGVSQNLAMEINCNETIKNIKHKLFPDDINKDLNVRLIYMGKILDDKKKLEDYLTFYQKEFLINNKKENFLPNEHKNESNKDTNNQNDSKNSKEVIPITIHVKITEKSTTSKNVYVEGKGVSMSLAQISLLAFVLLLWIYGYNKSNIFPIFCSVVLIVFTIFILTIIFYSNLISFFKIIFKVVSQIYKLVKNYLGRLCTYIIAKKQSLFVSKKIKIEGTENRDKKNN